MKKRIFETLSAAALLSLGSACAHGGRVTPARAPEPAAQAEAPDPARERIAEADAHLERGMAEARDGHLIRARREFDEAVDAYLTYPGGAYADERLAEAYLRTLNTVHLWELEALAAGDGFTETAAEPASIDEVGALVSDEPASEALRRTTEDAVQGEANDFPVELNDSVLSGVDLYTGRLREWFAGALQRSGRYMAHIREIFASEGIPQDLAYLALVESAFKPQALSRAKARGVWQFMPATGKRYGLNQDWWVDERSDPEKATVAAARYLKALYAMFGDWNLAMAAYNAGEMKVQRGLKRYGSKTFWELAKTRALRRETRSYVPLIHAAIVVAKAPEKYGFEIEPDELPAWEPVSVAGAVDLRFISECASSTLDDVRLLNPALRRLATPAGRNYELRVPAGTGAAVQTCLESVPPDRRVRFRTHVVARGQTLSGIAGSHGVRTSELAAANGIPLTRLLRIGQELMIPIDPRIASAATAAGPRAKLAATGTTGGKIRYRIRRGDTLAAIASQYGTTIRDIQSWNGLRNTRIVAGDTLTIFAGSGF